MSPPTTTTTTTPTPDTHDASSFEEGDSYRPKWKDCRPAPFKGEEEDIPSVCGFLFDVKRAVTQCGVKKQELLFRLGECFASPASTWYNGWRREQPNATLEDFSTAFREHWLGYDWQSRTVNERAGLRLSATDLASVLRFNRKFSDYTMCIPEGYTTPALNLVLYQKALPTVLGHQLLSRGPKTLKEAMAITEQHGSLESAMGTRRDHSVVPPNTQKSSSYRSAEHSKSASSSGTPSTRSTGGPTSKGRSQMRCYKCNERGHFARDCPAKTEEHSLKYGYCLTVEKFEKYIQASAFLLTRQ